MDDEIDTKSKNCLLGRPPHPDDSDFEQVWPQFLRDVLEASGQVHKHSDTCFKNTNVSMAKLDDAQRNELCRFQYPLPLVPETFMDEDGKIHHQRTNPNVVGYNPSISGSFQCNTDGKYIGSGALGMALTIYMTNYTAKSSMDSAIVVSALAAALKALDALVDGTPITVDEERCRRLLLKTLNQMNARRELSAQQVVSALLGHKYHVTNARFSTFYWSQLLNWLCPDEFSMSRPQNDTDSEKEETEVPRLEYPMSSDIYHSPLIPFSSTSPNIPESSGNAQDPDEQDDTISDETEEPEDHVEIDTLNNLTLLTGEGNLEPPPLNSLVLDILYRPKELEEVCMWDQMSLYEKIRRVKKRRVVSVPTPGHGKSIDQDGSSGSDTDSDSEGATGSNGKLYLRRSCINTK